ncbi:hypothetical protein ACLH0K_16985 [Arthrobacter sp. MPF02]|uniref:hypothetical protein n=1 Tax=Arthrobacter sp. MPF02 TaxID=3388492 RepID=UPI0039851106
MDWARIGLEFVLGTETSAASWHGKGPHQSYPDTGERARPEWLTFPLVAVEVDYVRTGGPTYA